jgi:hypothetical protein
MVSSLERAGKPRGSILIGFLSYAAYYFNVFVEFIFKNNPLTFRNPRFMEIIYKLHLILNGKYSVSLTMRNFLLRFRKIVAVYSENHMKHLNTIC